MGIIYSMSDYQKSGDTNGNNTFNILLTYPTGKGIAVEPLNSPGPSGFRLVPKSMLHSLRNDTVLNGRTKSWLSMCGGIQSPGSQMLTMQLSGMQDVGNTCQRTNLLIITLKRTGIGSGATFRRMPGGFPSLSCQQNMYDFLSS